MQEQVVCTQHAQLLSPVANANHDPLGHTHPNSSFSPPSLPPSPLSLSLPFPSTATPEE